MEEVGGVGLAMGNQIIRHFFVKLRLFNMSLFDTVDLSLWKSTLFAQSFDLGTAHLSKELFGTGHVSGLLPILRPKEGRIRCSLCHSGCAHLKNLLLVIVRNEVR